MIDKRNLQIAVRQTPGRRFATTQAAVTLGLVMVLASAGVAALETPSEDRRNFRELVRASWLSCSFEPIEVEPGKQLDIILFDEDETTTRLVTTPVYAAEAIQVFTDNQRLGRMDLVFDANKSRVRWLLAGQLATESDAIESLVNLQQADWITPGSLQITHIVRDRDSSIVINLVIHPRRVSEDAFAAIASTSFLGGLIVAAGRCTDVVDESTEARMRKALDDFEREAEKTTAE